MPRALKIAGGVVCIAAVVGVLVALIHSASPGVLSPQGTIADSERRLIIFGALLSVVIVVPVFALTIGIAWRYRAGNTTAKYIPEWDHSRLAETIWWLVPSVLILTLSIVTWRSSHELDPYRSLASNVKPLTIQVVALDWKWLFIYPAQKIATVNYVQFPAATPVNFVITADAPMNSFWIPQLGGQVYAMPGMSTQLHLMADSTGSYRGSSANISGEGFAGMKFIAKSTSQADFDRWVSSVQASPSQLSLDEYRQLAKPSDNNAVASFSSGEPGLYDDIVLKFTSPTGPLSGSNSSGGSMAGMVMP